MVFEGEIVKILTQKENDWGRYQVKGLDGKKLLCVGVIPQASLGMDVTLDGMEQDTQWGHQYKITAVKKSAADKNAAARTFLGDGYLKGIGPTKANAIITKFGAKAVKLFETPEGLKKLLTVKGITENLLAKAMPTYEENKKLIPIIEFLNGSGTKKQISDIYEKYGDGAVRMLKKNPYVLVYEVDGFGFQRTDALALASGIRADSKERIMAGLTYVLDDAATGAGHCYLMTQDIEQRIGALLAPMPKFSDVGAKAAENAAADWKAKREAFIEKYSPSAETLAQMDEVIKTREFIRDNLYNAMADAIDKGIIVNDDGAIYTKKMYDLECNIADSLAKLASGRSVRYIKPELVDKAIKDVEERKTKEFEKEGRPGTFVATEEQKNAVYTSLMHRVSIISGGPGRGKTAIAEIVAHGFLLAGHSYNREDVIMLAPTGRAAQRITESTGYPSMTAHRAVLSALKSHNYPNGKLVICDESSMVDVNLMAKILNYAKDCNLIFMGDVYQIASVGPGKVLKDMIDSGDIPCTILLQGHRNSGTIARNAELINAGMKIDRYTYDEHFIYIPSAIDKILDNILKDYVAKVKQYGITNVMLCSAMKDHGQVCVNKLNDALQELFTKGHKEAKYGSRVFRVGDRVMQTKNDYSFQLVSPDGTIRDGVFNGERGTIAEVRYNPETEQYNLVVRFDDGSLGGYTPDTAQELTLAYATTLHKCQGSEADCMMMAYTYGDYMLLNRSLFYTGETRAKKEFRMYGEEQYRYGKMLSAFDIAVGKTDDIKRNTKLAERIRTAMDAIAA